MAGRVVILGAGLTGLSTSLHLEEDWHVELFEKEDEIGGLARSRRVAGFTFDYTGHLLHLRDEGVKQLVARLLPDAFSERERHAVIYSHGVTTNYPFQANLHGLPPEVIAECLTGFVEALLSEERPEDANNFKEWCLRCFGEGIAKHFMIPYNSKIYACDVEEMTADWVSWSVPRPSLEQVVGGALGLTNEGMGYNPTFRYPTAGGIDCLPQALAREARGIELGIRAESIDLDARTVTLSNGQVRAYDQLVSTLPLPELIARTHPLPEWAKEAAAQLRSVTVCCFNIGVRRDKLSEHSWIYVPEAEFPFYRVGFPDNFCDAVSPPGCSSMYVEVAVAHGEQPDLDELKSRVIQGLQSMSVLRTDDELVVVDQLVIEHAYVLFDPHRSRVRERLLDLLLEHDIQSVGRYGVWTYSAMEDAIIAGRKAAEHIHVGKARSGPRAGER